MQGCLGRRLNGSEDLNLDMDENDRLRDGGDVAPTTRGTPGSRTKEEKQEERRLGKTLRTE